MALTVSVFYSDHKIPAGVCDCFHHTPRILCDWSLGKQLSYKRQIYTGALGIFSPQFR